MKPNFALDLSHEGIALLHRAPGGKWTEVGEVALDDPAFGKTLSFLRSTAVGLEGKGFATKLIIPNSQILYLDVEAPGPGDAERREQIAQALEGKTPYAVSDLAFDWYGAGPVVRVAVLARETLDEAEEFAVEHRFNPISFVARESDSPGAWEPFFGRTDYSHAFLGADADVRDVPPPGQPADSLFAADTGAPGGDSAAENLFVPDAGDGATENIFAEPETPEPADKTPEAPMAEDVPTVAPAFASRRGAGQDSLPDEVAARPIARISPRIALPEAVAPAPQEPPNDPAPTETEKAIDPGTSAPEAPGLVAEDRLRASLLSKADRPGPGQRLAPVLTAIRHRLGPVAGQIKALVARARPSARPAATGQAGAGGQRRRIVLSAAALIVLLGLIGLVITLWGGAPRDASSSDPAGTGATEIALSTTAPERGVRADNRARPRPSDFSDTVARMTALDKALDGGAGPVPSPIRPERRSLFEGGTDPEAGLPDTARPVTDLTERELADIRAAGLPAPTLEELAEGGEASDAGLATPEDIAVAYAETGALQVLSRPPTPNPDQDRDDIFVAALDRPLEAQDAYILPDFNGGVEDDPPPRLASPLGPDVTFDLDDRGLVRATREGALNPEGVLVRLGKPPVRPPEKPKVEALVPPDPLAALKPKPRPTDLRTGEDAIFVQGRMTLAQLRAFRARPRPLSDQVKQGTGVQTPSELAVLTSFQPAKRPSDFAKTVEKTRARLASTAPATDPVVDGTKVRNINTGPQLPTRANVAKTATIRNAINLSRMNLIGVYGSRSKRSALLRLPSGRFVKVKIGDRIDGGRVAAIGEDSLSYVKSGRNRVLKVPK